VVFVSDAAKQSLEKYLNKRTDIDEAVFVRDSKALEKFENAKEKAKKGKRC